jgi:hypothetical protein
MNYHNELLINIFFLSLLVLLGFKVQIFCHLVLIFISVTAAEDVNVAPPGFGPGVFNFALA